MYFLVDPDANTIPKSLSQESKTIEDAFKKRASKSLLSFLKSSKEASLSVCNAIAKKEPCNADSNTPSEIALFSNRKVLSDCLKKKGLL